MNLSVPALRYWDSLFDRLCLAVRKNPFGMTREEAKKAYFRFRNRGEGEEERSGDPPPRNPEQQMEHIMRCVEETNQRLGRIEEDIELLKDQVGLILKKL